MTKDTRIVSRRSVVAGALPAPAAGLAQTQAHKAGGAKPGSGE